MFRDRPTLGFKVCVQGLGFRVLVLGWSGVLFFGGLSLARSLARSLSLFLFISFLGAERQGGKQGHARNTKENQGKPRKTKESQGNLRKTKEKQGKTNDKP